MTNSLEQQFNKSIEVLETKTEDAYSQMAWGFSYVKDNVRKAAFQTAALKIGDIGEQLKKAPKYFAASISSYLDIDRKADPFEKYTLAYITINSLNETMWRIKEEDRDKITYNSEKAHVPEDLASAISDRNVDYHQFEQIVKREMENKTILDYLGLLNL